jgi:uridine kinase
LRWSIAPNEAVVIVDGLFLHRPQFFKANGAKLWDYSVWLDVSFAVAFDRLCHSAGLDADPLADSNSRYYAGERLYIERCDPAAHADVVVDNTDPHDSVD